MEMFPTLVLQVVLAVVVAKLTLAGSRSQKWWERKERLYVRLIEQLYDIQNCASRILDDINLKDASLTAESRGKQATQRKTLAVHADKADDEVKKLVHIGTFLISAEVHQDLLVFIEATHRARTNHGNGDLGDLYDLADFLCNAAKKCIASVNEHSKDDLGLNSKFGRLIQRVRALLSE